VATTTLLDKIKKPFYVMLRTNFI
jgi:hypothetical protein